MSLKPSDYGWCRELDMTVKPEKRRESPEKNIMFVVDVNQPVKDDANASDMMFNTQSSV